MERARLAQIAAPARRCLSPVVWRNCHKLLGGFPLRKFPLARRSRHGVRPSRRSGLTVRLIVARRQVRDADIDREVARSRCAGRLFRTREKVAFVRHGRQMVVKISTVASSYRSARYSLASRNSPPCQRLSPQSLRALRADHAARTCGRRHPPARWAVLVLDREFETQSVDPMFLEPECGLAWYDADRKNLELVLGVQSPYEAAESIALLLAEAKAPFKPDSINAQFAYVGGGFGGRDHTPFPLYVALAAIFFPGRPVRLAHDRYQQFQGGIKRHAFKMRTQIGVERASGKMIAFAADHVLDGGGLANYSASVASTGATGAIGIYDIPKVDVTTVAVHSRGVTAGSMRGYGTLQTMTALEVLIDEIATSLALDPIEFRRRNALKTGGRTMTGNPYSVSIRTPEILDKLEKHPIWQHRAAEKARGRRWDRHRYGRRLHHQGLRDRSRLFTGSGRDRFSRPHHNPG